MPKGIELFREKFAAHTDKYVLIGGTACELAMQEANLDFRATKDLDIVLTIETLDRFSPRSSGSLWRREATNTSEQAPRANRSAS